jgi:hypothetical protein
MPNVELVPPGLSYTNILLLPTSDFSVDFGEGWRTIPGFEWTIPANTRGTFYMKCFTTSLSEASVGLRFSEVVNSFDVFWWGSDFSNVFQIPNDISSEVLTAATTTPLLGNYSGSFKTGSNSVVFNLQMSVTDPTPESVIFLDYSSIELKYE